MKIFNHIAAAVLIGFLACACGESKKDRKNPMGKANAETAEHMDINTAPAGAAVASIAGMLTEDRDFSRFENALESAGLMSSLNTVSQSGSPVPQTIA